MVLPCRLTRLYKRVDYLNIAIQRIQCNDHYATIAIERIVYESIAIASVQTSLIATALTVQ